MAEGQFAGKTALVTGASRGIGKATALTLAARGANVVLTSRKQEGLDAVAAEIRSAYPGAGVLAKAAHAAQEEQAVAAVSAAVDEFGALDILVNNAGTNPHFGPMTDIEASMASKTFEVNQLSIVLWTKAAWRAGMSESGGSIVNIASVGGLLTEVGIGFYNSTKAAVIHLTRQFAAELGPKVRVNCVAPGLVRTKLAGALIGEHEEQIAAVLPLRRIGEPDDIAKAIAFLASEDSSWMTGQAMAVDGGATVRFQIA